MFSYKYKMSEDFSEEEKDESYKILYLTFMLMAVFLFFFIIINMYDTPILEAINDEANAT